MYTLIQKYVLLLLIGACLAGCSRTPVTSSTSGTNASESAKSTNGETYDVGTRMAEVKAPTPDEKYQSALLESLNCLSDRKYVEALTALQTAQAVRDSDEIRQQIDKVKGLILDQQLFERTVADIQSVIDLGLGEQASQLTLLALAQFGDGPEASKLMAMKRQADALLSAGDQDRMKQIARLREEAESALRENNLRAAVLCYEQALALKQDNGLQQQLEPLRDRLNKYDAAMEKAGLLRRSDQDMNVVVSAYQEAVQVWDTKQVRQELADAQLALRNRRDRLAIATFDARGNAQLSSLASSFPDEILSVMKRRFDLVDREHLSRIISELKIGSDDFLISNQVRDDLEKMTRAQYLVIGSVSPISGVTIHARLLELRTGLIVQTAKIVAPSIEQAVKMAPQLAEQLLMNDEEKMEYEQKQINSSLQSLESSGRSTSGLPVFDQKSIPAAIIYSTARPPGMGRLQVEDYDRLPGMSSGITALPAYSLEEERPLRAKLLSIQLELGDNLFRRGRHSEALLRFQLARELDPSNLDILSRINQCYAYLPPITAQPSVMPLIKKNRLALLPFYISGDPRHVSPVLSSWIPENLAAYYSAGYDVIEPGEVHWMMGRLGLTLGDVIHDGGVRRWLGRALGVRYFVAGRLQENGGLTVTVSILDSEKGWETTRTQIVVQNLRELKWRLPEIARFTMASVADRVRLEQDAAQWEAEYLRAQQAFQRGQFTIGFELTSRLRQRHPDNIRINCLFHQCQDAMRDAALDQSRMRELQRQHVLSEQAARRQAEFILIAERARQNITHVTEIEKKRLRDLAQGQLIAQARLAIQGNKFSIALQLFDGALALHSNNDAILLEAAGVRARMEEDRRKIVAEAERRQAEAHRREQELALAASRQHWHADRQNYSQLFMGQLTQVRQQDMTEYTRLLDLAQRLRAQGRYDQEVATLQNAKQLHSTDEVNRLLSNALIDQARAQAKTEDALRLTDLEKKLAIEAARRKQNEQLAERNWGLYQAALKQAVDAHHSKNLALAVTRYQEAARYFQTDEVTAGLQTAQAALLLEEKRIALQKKATEEHNRKKTIIAQHITAAQSAEKQRKYDAALNLLHQAKEIEPTNVEVLAAILRLEQLKIKSAEDQLAIEQRDKAARIKRMLSQAESRSQARQYDAALAVLMSVQQLAPNDQQVTQMILQVRNRQAAEAQSALQLKKKQEEAAQALALRIEMEEKAKIQAIEAKKQVETALAMGDLRKAESILIAARKLAPSDPALTRLYQELIKAQSQATRVKVQADAKVKLEADAAARQALQSQQHADRIAEVLKKVQAAIGRKEFSTAEKLLGEALAMDSTNLSVGRAQRELQQARQADATQQASMSAAARKKQEADLARKKTDFTRLMKEGKEALASEDFDKAAKLFTDAKALHPDDADAALFLGMAKRDSERAKAAAEMERKEAEANKKREMEAARTQADQKKKAEEELRKKLAMDAEAKKRADALKALNKQQYDSAVQNGNQALTTKRYDDAIKAFEKAIQLVPDDAQAKELIAKARQLKGDAAREPVKQPGIPSKMTTAQLISQATSLQRQQKWAEALAYYRQALAQSPDDKTARTGANLCEFQVNFELGKVALGKKEKTAAVNALEAALKLAPGHQETQRLLKQAREMKQ